MIQLPYNFQINENEPTGKAKSSKPYSLAKSTRDIEDEKITETKKLTHSRMAELEFQRELAAINKRKVR